jgi:hypothetical protein
VTVTIASIEFDRVRYDADADGLTLVRPKRLLEREGELRITVPVPSVVPAAELTPALSA